MARIVVTLKIMPESPETDFDSIEIETKKLIERFVGRTETKTEFEEIGFGLKAMKLTFIMDESKGSTDALEDQIRNVDGVNSVEVIDVRRTIG
ncbi:elongation factor 1-beta [Candidatus Woesearchaeota archaeon]|nr:elongation factor 1-beta [Candidatus Woesearchaeota archaeon]